jgi:phosphohistidine phosphatase
MSLHPNLDYRARRFTRRIAMDVYIIRHAQAIDRDTPVDDAHRPLTARGRKDARKLGKALDREEVGLDAIVTSPLVRSVETAELVAVGLGWDDELEVAPELSPARDPAEVVREVLLPRAELKAVAVVGHEPQLSALIALLLQRETPSPSKASVVRLRWEGPEQPAKFKWVLHPDGEGTRKELDAIAGG